MLEWRRLGEHNVRCPEARWTDNCRMIDGSGWMRTAQDQNAWLLLGEAIRRLNYIKKLKLLFHPPYVGVNRI